MLRTERPRLEANLAHTQSATITARELLFAVAPPPRTHVYSLAGWPTWLTPTYRSGAQRSGARRQEDDER
jgi:hypothetical protein